MTSENEKGGHVPLLAPAIPCHTCDTRNDCRIGSQLEEEIQSAIAHQKPESSNETVCWVTRLVDSFFRSLAGIYATDVDTFPPGMALAALFDLCVNAIYVRLASDKGWIYCLGPVEQHPPAQYYAFVGACPRCTMLGHYVPAKPHKPQSAEIGDASALSLVVLLQKLLATMTDRYRMVATTKRRGDVDVFIGGPDLLTLAEIKASPLITYPLEIRLKEPVRTESPEGELVPSPNHDPDSPRIVSEAETIYLYIPHHPEMSVELGRRTAPGWPFGSLVRFVSDQANVQRITRAWMELFEVYATRKREPRLHLTHGCGSAGGVAISDGKNAPGLDRTDDIKKGTYQVLKYGSYFAEKCPRRLIKCALLGNVHTVVHYEHYLKGLENVMWTKRELLRNLSQREIAVNRTDLFDLYDGIICFTGSFFRSDLLKDLFNLEKLAERLADGARL